MSYRQFVNEIKEKGVNRCYLITGLETYLIDKSWEHLKSTVVTDFPELNYTQLEGEHLDADQLAAACETFPFGCEKRLVAVRDFKLLKASGKSEGEADQGAGKDAQAFIDIVSNLPDTTCLLFVSYGGVDKRRKIVGEIKKSGSVYEFDRVERDDLGTWIRSTLTKNGNKIGPRELDAFINMSGYLDKSGSKTLYDLENMLSKLTGYIGAGGTVTIQHIEAIMPRNVEHDIFKLINACSEKRVSESLQVYGDLLLEGESSLGILALLSKQIKNIMMVSSLHEQRMDARGIAGKLKLHEYTVKLCLKYSTAINKSILQSAFNKCLNTELGIKSGKMGERLAMELLLVSLFE